ncbi:MAG: tetratricopeptide repeat protein, partial [Chloroflexi bacterium]|nr:tetratricopeptide repeat protein [Chloroflexota bacterium]
MTTITLHEYIEKIDQFIADNQLDEAVAHSRNILQKFPRHIDTYRLLAKVLLEQEQYEDAADLFQRVLSTDPNDFIAHVGMSIVLNADGEYEQALWHLERAFEIQPYNAAIQEELRQQYAQLSDNPVDRIPLTSGALARLYIKGEMYQQAVKELRHTLDEVEDRIDLEVLLAEALWLNEQRIDAEEVCLNVLERLPNCIMTNAILSEIWLQTGRIGESQKYLLRLQELTSLDRMHLNLETAVGRAFYTDGAPTLPEKIELEFIGAIPDMPAPAVVGETPSADWMNDVSFDADISEGLEYGDQPDIVVESESGMHDYDWMADVHDDDDTAADIPLESEWFMDDHEEVAAAAVQPTAESDWLADVDDSAVASDIIDEEFELLFADSMATDDPEPETEPAKPETDWFGEQAADGEFVVEEFASEQAVPDWLNDLVGEQDQDMVENEAALEMEMAQSDWFVDVDGEDEPVLEETEAEGIPDWLNNLMDEPKVEVGVDEASLTMAAAGETVEAEGADEELWFLEDVDEDGDETTADEAIPDWLLGAADGVDDVTADSPAAEIIPELELAAEPDEAIPDWLLGADGVDDTAVASQEEDDLDWFGDLVETDVQSPQKQATIPEDGLPDDLSAVDEDETPLEQSDAVEITGLLATLAIDEQLTADEVDDTVATDEDETLLDQPEFGGITGLLATMSMDEQLAADAESAKDSAGEDEADWLATLSQVEGEDEQPEPESEDDFLSLEDLESWVGDSAEDKSADDWLVDEDVGLTSLLAAVDDQSEIESSLPDQISEVLSGSDEDEIPAWLLGDDLEGSDEVEAIVMGDKDEKESEQPVPSQPEMETEDDLVAADITDWLSDLSDDETAVVWDDDHIGETAEDDKETAFESSMTDWLSDASEEEPDVVLDDTVEPEFDIEAGLTDWLTDFEDEPETAASGLLAALDDPSFSTEEPLPDLESVGSELELEAGEVEADIPEISSEELFATDEDNLPDWLTDLPEDSSELAAEPGDLPDWLLDSQDASALDGVEAAVEPAAEFSLDDFAVDAVDDDFLAGVLDEELTGEEEPDLTVAGLTALLSDIEGEEDLGTLQEDTDWLDQLSAAEQVEDTASLDWLAMPDESPAEARMEADLLPESAVEEETEIVEPVDIGIDGAMEDLEDTMSWLEELAAQQETPVDDMPTVAQDLLAEELLSDSELPILAGTAAEDESWLTDLIDESAEPIAEVETEISASEAAELSELPEDTEEALDWLEGLAVQQDASLDELSTVQDTAADETEDFVDDDAQTELDDAMSWLNDLAFEEEEETEEDEPEEEEAEAATMAEAIVVAEEPETPPQFDEADLVDELDLELADALNQLEAQLESAGIMSPVRTKTVVPITDEVLAAELDWLEGISPNEPDELAVEDEPAAEPDLSTAEEETIFDLPLPDVDEDETPLVEAALEQGETSIDLGDMPDNPDAAMAWLEQMAAGDEDITFDMEPPPITPSEDAKFAADYGAAPEPEAEMAEDETVVEAALDMEPAVEEETAVAAEVESELDLFEMGDDEDGAMAWLEQMAAGDEDITFDMEPPPIT